MKTSYPLRKRLFDLTIAGTATLLLSPVIAAVALLVLVSMGRPVLFRQQRPGRGGVPFYLLKFRTMTNERDQDGNLLPNAERLTPLGRFLRKSSLDELPQLFNVLKGEMSIVGPRPLLMVYLPHYPPRLMERHRLPPGITGLAQIEGRYLLSWEERFRKDLEYVDSWSFSLDLEILWKTLGKVIQREGMDEQTFSGERPDFAALRRAFQDREDTEGGGT
ncbi:MAG: sugar transferase [Synergistales bacterium]|nr:sugar transferase [Synergistales bacterium]